MFKQPWTNIEVLQISKTRALLPRQIELLIRSLSQLWWSISTVAHYEKMDKELQRPLSTYANDSSSASINDNDIYYNIVGDKDDKENKFIHSTRIHPTLIEMPMLLAKEAMEKSLEEKVVQLMNNHEEKKEQL
ncbi:hypothetical protein CR513_23108, partial [Mucuna pruriens]